MAFDWSKLGTSFMGNLGVSHDSSGAEDTGRSRILTEEQRRLENAADQLGQGSAFIPQILETASLYKDDPSKYFKGQQYEYQYGQMPQAFQAQSNPYKNAGWKILENAGEGAATGANYAGPWGALVGGVAGLFSGGAYALGAARKRDQFEQAQRLARKNYNIATADYDMYQANNARQIAQNQYMNRLSQSPIPAFGSSIYQYV